MRGRLASIKLLEGLPADELDRLAMQCHWHSFPRDAVILDRDQAGEERTQGVFFLAEGQVQVVNYTLSGRPVAYATLGQGECFGELSAIDGLARSASVVAAAPCVVARLPAAAFLRLLEEQPAVAMRLMRRLVAIVRACDERIMDLATLGAMQRVIIEIVRLAQPDPITPTGWVIYPCPAQRQIAEKAATTRETVARVFAQLLESGQVRRKGRSLYLRDRRELERLAQRLAPATPVRRDADGRPESETRP